MMIDKYLPDIRALMSGDVLPAEARGLPNFGIRIRDRFPLLPTKIFQSRDTSV
ncbi:hypothetical protein [Microcoleus sp. FACHB-831]|uniref:hypothetical protein n=1 Tax=Microcoleus sp. FACHB-831 TaxID=2692827 RepID=UPI001689CC4B|nr:hypothetical protein [Microcoleus sp. FACHB-831]